MKSYLSVPFHLLNHVFSWLAPKSRDIWIYGEWFGEKFGDNSSYAYTAAASRPLRKIWITRSVEILKSLRAEGRECYLATSLYGLYIQSRAKVFFCTVNSRDFCFSSLTRRNVIIQLWHGLPLKKIGFDVSGRPAWKRVIDLIRSNVTDHYSYVVSPAAEFDEIMQSAFHAHPNQVVRSLYPRCDGLFESSRYSRSIRDYFNVTTSVLLFYLPTHRKEGRDPVAINRLIDSMKLLADDLARLDVTIIIKPHFYDRDNVSVERCGNVIVTKDLPADLYRSLSSSDGLITDYSSISLDYLSTGKPIFYFVPDMLDYVAQDRESYFDLASLMPGAAASIDMLGKQLKSFVEDGSRPPAIGINVVAKDYDETISARFQRLSEELIYGG